jgi:hypothetical protein
VSCQLQKVRSGYRGGSGSRIAPIDEWETDDREELTELLEIAASEPH